MYHKLSDEQLWAAIKTAQERAHNAPKSDTGVAMDNYRKAKAIKLDAVMGKYSVKHGAFLDRDVIRRAANLSQ